LVYAHSLKFEEKPDYNKMKFMLKKIVLGLNQKPVEFFDWR
jgi:hypothetical protein